MTKYPLFRWLALAVTAALALPTSVALAQDGGSVDAGSTATMQPITVTVTLDAAAHVTPRTWNFLVEDEAGRLVDSLQVRTTRDVPMASAATQPLANGEYVVRLLPGSHVATACYSGIFFEIIAPSGGTATVTMQGTPEGVAFAFAPCPDNPDELGVEYSSDPGAGVAAPAAADTGTASEVTPAPPATGSGLAAPAGHGRGWPAIAGAFLFVFGAGFAAAASLAQNRKR